jgi:hypothetical protein
MDKSESIITLENLLLRFDTHTKKFIKELEREESNESMETIDSLINNIKAQKNHTKIQKSRFIDDIKSGLGNKIKENPTTIIKYKKPWYSKLSEWFKNILIKF